MADPGNGAKDWERVLGEEESLIDARRNWLRSTGWDCPQPPAGKVGLALSGGGIRSATFSLGLMKSLSKSRLVHSIDYLSTVSGGGYAGSFYCSLFIPNRRRGAAPSPQSQPDEEFALANALGPDVLGSRTGRQALSQLRQGGHYLAPNGTSDAMFAAVIAARNWFAVALVSGLAILGLFLLMNLVLGLSREPVSQLISMLGLAADADRRFNPLGVVLDLASGFLGGKVVVRPDVVATPWTTTLVLLALWPAACAWAYWFTRSGHVPRSRIARLISIQSFIAVAVIVFLLWPGRTEGWPNYLRLWIPLISGLALLTYALAEFVCFAGDRRQGAKGKATDYVQALAQEDRVRNRLSRWLLKGVFVLGAVAVIVAIDNLVDTLFSKDASDKTAQAVVVFRGLPVDRMVILVVAAVVVAVIARFVLQRERTGAPRYPAFERFFKNARRSLALVVGLGMLVILLIFWSAVARAIALYLTGPGSGLDLMIPKLPAAFARFDAHVALAALTLFVLGAAFLLGQVDALLNRSSLAAFYSGRLRAAYLGATNSRRWRLLSDDAAQGKSRAPTEAVDQDDPNDEITLGAYYATPLLSPLHLINVTINETTSKSSRVIQRDRKGKSMTVAPSGYLYPPNSPSEPLALLPREGTEDLPLSSWVAISGAAFTTGAGFHTSLGTAMLASLTNMRLGYWWERRRPGFWRWRRPSKLVQSYLLRELRANYEGTSADRWYLSDGGHYENTGVYELVRRRVPFIIASDNGADPNYAFTDVVNLIRKLRIDFEAEVEFLDDEQLEILFGGSPLRDVFGTLEAIRSRGAAAMRASSRDLPQPRAGPYATLARIRYHAMDEDTPPTTLLLIKPRITGKELPDLLQYREVNAAFPQQPTTNQFFDEAQWESYYRLGQLIGDMIFDKGRFQGTAPAAWEPWKLEPLPESPVALDLSGFGLSAKAREPAFAFQTESG